MAEHIEVKCDELLKKIEDDCLKAKSNIKYIEDFNSKCSSKEKNDLSFVNEKIDLTEKIKMDDIVDESSKFESFVSLYLPDFLKLSGNITIHDLIKILPPKSNGYYKDLIYRLLMETKKEINEFTSFDISDLSESDLCEYRELLDNNKRKISLLKEALNYECNNTEEENKELNEIVLVPTSGGNIRILEDLKKIPNDFYSTLYDLIKSIETGEFQGLKKLTNNGNVDGIYELKGSNVRVLFSRLSSNHYALITCFLKKVNFDNYYNSIISNASSLYNRSEDILREQLSNEEFIKENALYVEELFRVLGNSDKKEYTRGGINA